MTKTAKIAFRLFLTGLLCLIPFTTPASAARLQFKLDFWDEESNLVGNGQFSYDDALSTCLTTSGGGVCEPNDPLYGLLDAIIVTNLLTNASATIAGKTWGLVGTSWWSDDDSGQISNSLFSVRGNYFMQENELLFQDIRENVLTQTGFLNLYIAESSDNQGAGNWQLSFFDLNSPNGFQSDSGTWQARPILANSSAEKVPEPSNLIGRLIALGFASYPQGQVIIPKLLSLLKSK